MKTMSMGRNHRLLDAELKSAGGSSGKIRCIKAARAAPAKAVAPFWHTGSLLSATLCRILHLHGCAVLLLSGARCSG